MELSVLPDSGGRFVIPQPGKIPVLEAFLRHFASCRDFGVRLRFNDTDVVGDYEYDGGFRHI
jgi:hypothetical protein